MLFGCKVVDSLKADLKIKPGVRCDSVHLQLIGAQATTSVGQAFANSSLYKVNKDRKKLQLITLLVK